MKKLFIITLVVIGMFACAEHRNTKDGALPGKFSVSPSKQVHFSQGNLQYQASTNTWRFAENQWDYVGDYTNGSIYIGEIKSNNNNIAEDYNGWIDLFGYGTGKNPTLSIADRSCYTLFADWGANKISNGGNMQNQWRTLNIEEWDYLFCKRPNASDLFAFGCVNNINGLIILPDNWSLPKECNFVASTQCGLYREGELYIHNTLYTHNTHISNYEHNRYTIEQWEKMEHAGAVFFPACGDRTFVDTPLTLGAGETAYYWSSTPYYIDEAYLMAFNWHELSMYHYRNCVGQAVRLVKSVK